MGAGTGPLRALLTSGAPRGHLAPSPPSPTSAAAAAAIATAGPIGRDSNSGPGLRLVLCNARDARIN